MAELLVDSQLLQGPSDHILSPANLRFLRGQTSSALASQGAISNLNANTLGKDLPMQERSGVDCRSANPKLEGKTERKGNAEREGSVGMFWRAPEQRIESRDAQTGSSAKDSSSEIPQLLTLTTNLSLSELDGGTEKAPKSSAKANKANVSEVRAQIFSGSAPTDNRSVIQAIKVMGNDAHPFDHLSRPSASLVSQPSFEPEQLSTSNKAVKSGSGSSPSTRPEPTNLSPLNGTQLVQYWLLAQGNVKVANVVDKTDYVPVSSRTTAAKGVDLGQGPNRRLSSSTLRSKKAAEGSWYRCVDENIVARTISLQKAGNLPSSQASLLFPSMPPKVAMKTVVPAPSTLQEESLTVPPPPHLSSPIPDISYNTALGKFTANDENVEPVLSSRALRCASKGPVIPRSQAPGTPHVRQPLAEMGVRTQANVKLDKPTEWQGTPAPRLKQQKEPLMKSPTKAANSKPDFKVFPRQSIEQPKSQTSALTSAILAEIAARDRKLDQAGPLEHFTVHADSQRQRPVQVIEPSVDHKLAALKSAPSTSAHADSPLITKTGSNRPTIETGNEGPANVQDSLVARDTATHTFEQPAMKSSLDPFPGLLPDRNRAPWSILSRGISIRDPPQEVAQFEAAGSLEKHGRQPVQREKLDRITNVSHGADRWSFVGRSLADEILDAGESPSVFDGYFSP